MKSRAVGLLLLAATGCGAEFGVVADAAAAAPEREEAAGLSSRALVEELGFSKAGLAKLSSPAPPPLMAPEPGPDYSNAIRIEVQTSKSRDVPARFGGGGRETEQSFTLFVHTMPPQKIALGNWRHTFCSLGHDAADGLAAVHCYDNALGLAITLQRRVRGDLVDVRVGQSSEAGKSYAGGIIAQVHVPRGRPIHLVRSDLGEREYFEEQRYFPLE